MDASVLIVGAGPTGLVLALWLTKQGVPVRIIDQTAGPGATSRALAVQARTLELYRQLDLADAVVAKGYAVPGVRLWLGGREAARIPFAAIASDLTPYGFLHIFPQDEHERLLIERLAALRVAVERSTELLGYAEDGGRVSARLRGPDGAERTAEAAYHRRLRRRPFGGSPGIGRGLPGGGLPAALRRRRRRRRRPGVRRRPQHRTRPVRLPRRLPPGGRRPRPADRRDRAGRAGRDLD